MLIRLEINNFALIEQAVFEPGSGLTIITGETGAGKSILIDAISALKGSRLGKDSIRTGADSALIQGVVENVTSYLDESILRECGIDLQDEDRLYIVREISAGGKSFARVNGRIVPLNILKEIGNRVIDIHGQHDQQALFAPGKYLEMLDSFGHHKLEILIKNYQEILTSYKNIVEEIKKLKISPSERQKKIDILAFQIQELKQADFKLGEEEKLIAQREEIIALDRLREGIFYSLEALDASEEIAALSQLDKSVVALDKIKHINPILEDFWQRLTSLTLELEALGGEIRIFSDTLPTNASHLPSIEERLNLLFNLQLKYGSTIEEINQYKVHAESELESFEQNQSRLEILQKQGGQMEKDLLEKATLIHNARAEIAAKLSLAIQKELSDLEMKNTIFSVAFRQRPKEKFFSKTGYDEVDFMISTNLGEEAKPLAKVISGGEASRIMLAIKKILAQSDSIPTLIFDEIDTGISGSVATKVGQKLRDLGQSHQVLCVTHMAQIACFANQHFFVNKEEQAQRTITQINPLTSKQKLEEVARLLSGDHQDEASINLARQLIENNEM